MLCCFVFSIWTWFLHSHQTYHDKIIDVNVSISICVISKGFIWIFRNGFAPVTIFFVLNTTSPSDSVRFPRRTTAFGETLLGVPRGYAPLVAGEAREGEAVNPKGERWKGESEAVPPSKRVVMAKSSMVASTIPKSPIYQGKKDAYMPSTGLETEGKMVYSPRRMNRVPRPLAFFYQVGSRIKNFLFDRKVRKIGRTSLPVISVGNLAFGGSEKTPLVMHLLSFFIEHNLKPALITRGYKGRWEKSGGVLSNGKNIYGTWQEAGDEPFMVSRNFPQVGIFVGRNRLNSCEKAKHSGFTLVLLDDGFQHRKLHRDLDIILFDPGERIALRESLSSPSCVQAQQL